MIKESEYCVQKVQHPHPIKVSVPGSKSITNRALLIAALADGTSTLHGVLFSDDSRRFLQALVDLGFAVEVDEEKREVTITGIGGEVPKKQASVYVGSAGTAARFLTAFLALADGSYRMDSSEQMKKRPMQELMEALEALGASFSYAQEPYHFPFTVKGAGKTRCKCPDEVTIDVDKSSQFLSALLMVSVLFDHRFTIHVTGSHGMSYVHMTVAIMKQFGMDVQVLDDERTFVILPESHYRARDYQIEPDLSAACYFYGAGAILGVSAKVMHVHRDSLQGDIQFLQVLCDMGCSMVEEPDGICLRPSADGTLRGGEWDLSAFADQALTLAAIAPMAKTPVTIEKVGHIRYQECDRIAAILENLHTLGVRAEEKDGTIVIWPFDEKEDMEVRRIHTFEDHRVAMAFALPGLRLGNVIIENPSCCRKTFEDYFETMEEVL